MNMFTKTIIGIVVVGVVAAGAGAAFVYSGAYNIGADDPHTRPVFALMETLRERSIEAHSREVIVPNLDDPAKIAEGAEHYSAMCTGCHLAPGRTDSEIRPGLYPQPPNLAEHGVLDPKEAFWVIKHGIKMSAMPAWGSSHDDAAIWNLVAFIRKMPQMTPAEYQQLAGAAGGEQGDHEHGHSHGGEGHHYEASATSSNEGHDHDTAAQDEHRDHTAQPEVPMSFDGLKPGAVPLAEAAATAFHAALQKGDRSAVLTALAPEVKISEGGHTQSRDEYAKGHLGEDIAFLKEAKFNVISMGSMPMGDSAMVGTETRITAQRDGKPVALVSREMLDLKRDGADWRIVRVRWQSEKAPESQPQEHN
jgi:mono/diheme cytochrome c family protein/ketosteroid isomerase-like protein